LVCMNLDELKAACWTIQMLEETRESVSLTELEIYIYTTYMRLDPFNQAGKKSN